MLRKILILLILITSSCAKNPADELRFGLASLPQNFDPRFATDAASERINHLLHCSLVRFDQARKPVPGIAEWERLDPTRYQFTLQTPRPTYWDGSAVSADDVVSTITSILDEANASPHRSTLAIIKAIRRINDDIVEFDLYRADPHFPSYLVTGILPTRIAGAPRQKSAWPIGCGEFELIAHDESSTRLVHRDSGRAVVFIRVQDPSTRVLKLLKGEIDMMQGDLSPQLVTYLEQVDEVEVLRRPGSNFSYLGFNLQDPVTGNPLVRRAVAHAIDRKAIIVYLFNKRARPANGLFPPEHWLTDAALPQVGHDPALARSLLQQAGFNQEQRLKLVYKTSSDPFRMRIATIIQQQLAEVGIDVDIKSYDWGTFYGDIKSGNFQLYSLTWVGLKTPDSYRYLFHSASVPPDGANRGRFLSDEADRLIELAEAQPELARQLPYHHRLQHHLLETLPYVPLWYEDQIAVIRNKASGYQLAADGNYDGLETLPWIHTSTSTFSNSN